MNPKIILGREFIPSFCALRVITPRVAGFVLCLSLMACSTTSSIRSGSHGVGKNPVDSWNYAAEGIVIDQTIESRLMPAVEARLGRGLGWGYVASVLEKGETKAFASGKKALEPIQEISTQDVLELGSISKVFTGVLLHFAQIEGRLDLNRGIEVLFPELKGTEVGQITPFDLGLHQAGLPSWPEGIPLDPTNPWKALKAAEALSALVRYQRPPPPVDELRHPRRYSNWGFLLLGGVLEKAFQEPFDRVLRSRILTPLGMRSTGVDLKRGRRSRAIPGLALDSESTPLWEFNGSSSALGGVESTALDMRAFLGALASPPAGKLGEAITAAMESGIGWDSEPGHLLLWKNGATASHSGILLFDRARRRGLYLGGNSNVRTDALAAFAMSLTPRDLMVDPLLGSRLPAENEVSRLKGQYVAMRPSPSSLQTAEKKPTLRSLRVFETLGRVVARALIEADGKVASAPVLLLPGAKENEWLALDGLTNDYDSLRLTPEGLVYSAIDRATTTGSIQLLSFELKKLPETQESYPATE